MKRTKHSNLFPEIEDMYSRYKTLKSNDPYADKRELYLKNYNRNAWKRTGKANCNRQDPNFGQFKFKIDAAMNIFVNVLTERNSFFKIVPKFPKLGANLTSLSEKITASFHKFFMAPWEDRFMGEIGVAADMVFYGKAIDHWPTPGCVYTENIPVEFVFPDTNAGMNTKKWSYVFIEKHFTIAELYDIIEEQYEEEEKGEKESESDHITSKFDKKYLTDMLEVVETYEASKSTSETVKSNQGEYSTGARDSTIPIIYAYIKDNFRSDNKVSLYVFPAGMENYKGPNKSDSENFPIKTLYEKIGYTECISRVLAVRAYQITRSYWKFNSFAQQIYLATAFYDKSMSLLIRTMKRNSILYLKSGTPETLKKILNQNDEEVQAIDDDVTYLQTGQNNNTREISETIRQIMVDTENGQSMAQAPGSQNVKGYAITAQEAQIRQQKGGEAESLNIKVLMNLDTVMYKELYRRAIDLGTSYKTKRQLKLFKEEMESLNIPKEYYDYDEVYFKPSFLNGASQLSRVMNAQGVLDALRQSPSSPGQEQAQRDLIGALVGVDNVDAYITEKLDVNPVIIKAGSENEDLDNPNVNPSNVPVLPDDKHLQELPIHIGDYSKKLEIAGKIIQSAMQNPSKFRQMIMLSAAQDLIMAQDNKGGHIMAHVQAASTSKENMQFMQPIMDEFKKAQSMQDQMTADIQQALDGITNSMQEGDIHSEKVRHMKEINQLTENNAKAMNDIAIAKEVEKKQSIQESRAFKSEAEKEKVSTSLAAQQVSSDIKLQSEKEKAEAKKKQNETTTTT